MVDWQGRCVLLTGASGYLAGRLAPRLAELGAAVRRWSRGRLAASDRYEDTTGELGDPSAWDRALDGVDLVVHLAAQTSAYRADADPVADLEASVVPVVRLLEGCQRRGGRVDVLLAGSATQVGLTPAVHSDESAPDLPVTVYDLHKLVAERYLFTYSRLGIVRGCTLRLANVYGPGPAGSSSDRGVLNRMVSRALDGQPLTIYGSGEQIRDYVFVDDVVDAFVAAAQHLDALDGQAALVGSETGHTIAQMVALVGDRVRARTGRDVEVQHVQPPEGLLPIEDRSFVADCRRLRGATGWRASIALQDGIDRTIEHMLGSDGAAG